MTAICYIGIELSARTQQLPARRSRSSRSRCSRSSRSSRSTPTSPPGSITPCARLVQPVRHLAARARWPAGCCSAIFIYWGWDSASASTRRPRTGRRPRARRPSSRRSSCSASTSSSRRPRRPSAATQSLIDNQDDVLRADRQGVLGSPLDKLLIIAVLTSASASTQTTILPTARTSLSMARAGRVPKRFGDVHPRYLTPSRLDDLDGRGLDRSVFVVPEALSQNLIADAFTALGADDRLLLRDHRLRLHRFYRRHLFESREELRLPRRSCRCSAPAS